MPFQPVPKVIHAALNGTLHLEQVQNNLYFLVSGAEPTASECEAVADTVAGWWVTNLTPLLSSSYTLRNVTATSLHAAIAPQFVSTAGLPSPGASASAALPGNSAYVISFRTGLAGRSARGRNYVPGLPENQVAGNQVEIAWSGAVVAAYEALLTAISPIGVTWVVVQRRADGDVLPAGVPRPVSAVVAVDRNVDSQRRRLAGRGA